MVNGVLRSDSGDPSFGSVPTPWGFSARYTPRDLVGYWIEVVALSAGRTGVLLGCCDSSESADDLRSDALAALLRTADPVQSLAGMSGSNSSALCAVFDQEAISYTSWGRPGGAIAAPGAPPVPLERADGRLVTSPLEPGSTVLLCSRQVGEAVGLLTDCAGTHPDAVADRLIVDLGDSAAVLYRHPPEPLSITLPADPGSLAISRGRLREWLTAAGLDSETCADVLLAAGEATANATEHSVVHAPGQVEITLEACFEPGALLLSVSDNGRWKQAAASPGHRGHGIHLMNALVNSVELTTAPQGTTVAMVKELPR